MNPNPGSGQNTDSGDLLDLSIELQSTLLNIGGQGSNKLQFFSTKIVIEDLTSKKQIQMASPFHTFF